MNKHETKEPWSERVVAVVKTVRMGLLQFIGFELMLRAIALVVFTPLVAWLMARLIAWSGDDAISNYDLAGFFLSAKGFVFLTAFVSVGYTLLFFEFGGLTALAIALQRGERVRLFQLFRLLGGALPRLWKLAVRQFLVYLAYAIPCLAAAACAWLVFLTKSDINYYLIAKPPEFWIAVVIVVISALVWAFFAIRCFTNWIHSVPLLLFTDTTVAGALRESRELVGSRRVEVIGMLLRWLIAATLLFGVFELLLWGMKLVLFQLAGQNVALVLGLTSMLAVMHFIGVGMVGVLAASGLACGEARLFLKVRPDCVLPESLSGNDQAAFRIIAKALGTGWVVILIGGVISMIFSVRLVDEVRFDKSNPEISAHRGSSITAPENTMAAIMLAVEEGADYVEIDVQETKDGTVVLVHDKDLKRVFGIEKGIWELTYDELKDLDSGGWFSPDFSDQRLATLDQVIKAVKGKAKLNIELKFNGHQKQLAKEVVRIVNENDFASQCILTSLDYDGIRRVRAADPNLRTGIIVTSAIGDITRLETDLLSISAGAVNRDLVQRARLKGLEVHVWTVNDIPLMNAMIGLGVDNIITDNPKLLGELVRERASLSKTEKTLEKISNFANHRF